MADVSSFEITVEKEGMDFDSSFWKMVAIFICNLASGARQIRTGNEMLRVKVCLMNFCF